MEREEQAETQTQQQSIKLNLTKEIFELEKKRGDIEEEISQLRRKITQAFTYKKDDEKKLYEDQKVKKEIEVGEVEEQIEEYIRKILNELKESKNKWLLQCYNDKISKFTKQAFFDASQKLELQYKEFPLYIMIARPLSHGMQIDELIEKSKQEQQKNPKTQSKQINSSDSKTAKQIQKESPLVAQIENPETTNSQKTNQQTKTSPEKSQQETQKGDKDKNMSNNTKAASKNSNKPSAKDNKNNNNSSSNKNNINKQQEEENLADIIKKSFENSEIKKDKNEILQEVEEEQKQMTKEEIIQSLNLPAESVRGYEIISMNDNYVLELKVHEPEQNSFPIQSYKVYLIKEKKDKAEISTEQLKNGSSLDEIYQSFEKQFLCSSKSSTIYIDLKQVPQQYILGMSDETSYFQISISALSWQPDAPDNFLESQLTHIIRLNMPKIIEKKTRLLLSGSCELIYPDFFPDYDQFLSNYSQDKQALKNFVSPGSELFNMLDIQAIDFGKSAMILLKNGQVIQWGNVLYFKEGIDECNIDKLKEDTIKLLINEPFMPVNHPLVFTKIAQGKSHYVGVTIDGKVYSWGKNKYGQLGHQNFISYAEPKKIEHFHLHYAQKFIVNVHCGDNFTVCQSHDGSLFTFGKNQASQGEPIKDLYNNTINMCNKGINQLIPKMIDLDSKIISYSCGKDHCLFITENNACYGWGDNYGSKICSSTFYKDVVNFAIPIPIVPNNSKDYIFKKVFCSDKSNCAVMQNKTTGEQVLIKWGGNTTLPFDILACKINLSLQKNENEDIAKIAQKPQLVTNFDTFYTTSYQSLLTLKENGKIKLYVNGENTFYCLGVRGQEIKNFQMAAIPPCEEILQASISSTNTTAFLIA
ncbi:hypothetical protein ABPG74_000007 [Tetrahymena malaccensis]